MDNWKSVPVEPTDEMIADAIEAGMEIKSRRLGALAVPMYQAMIAAAPQPPALDGEVEVVYMLRNTALHTPWRDADKAAFDCAASLVEYERRELVDRAHIARLQAEVERLKIWQENYAQLEKVFHSERENWNRESTADAKQSGKYRGERDAFQARTAELEGLLRDCRGPVIDASNNAEIAANTRLYEELLVCIDAALAEGAKS